MSKMNSFLNEKALSFSQKMQYFANIAVKSNF